jgi:PAS domain-containing protein
MEIAGESESSSIPGGAATSRPHAEELPQKALESERIRLIFETALDAVITMNDKGLITDWNPEAERTSVGAATRYSASAWPT